MFLLRPILSWPLTPMGITWIFLPDARKSCRSCSMVLRISMLFCASFFCARLKVPPHAAKSHAAKVVPCRNDGMDGIAESGAAAPSSGRPPALHQPLPHGARPWTPCWLPLLSRRLSPSPAAAREGPGSEAALECEGWARCLCPILPLGSETTAAARQRQPLVRDLARAVGARRLAACWRGDDPCMESAESVLRGGRATIRVAGREAGTGVSGGGQTGRSALFLRP